MKNLPLHMKIIIGLIAGVIFALLSSYMGWSSFVNNWINPWGEIFIRLLKLIAVPLVLFSIIKGVTGLSDLGSLGRLGAKTLLTYLITTVLAVTVGLTLVNVIGPGNKLPDEQRAENRKSYETWVAQNDQIDKPIDEGDPNLKSKMDVAKQTKEAGPLQFIVDMVPSNIFLSLNNNGLMLQVIFFSIFFGIAILMVPKEQSKYVIGFVDGANEVFLVMVDLVMKGAPFFVFALLAGVVSSMAGDDPSKVIEIFKGLGWYSITVVIGLALMVFVIYPIVIRLVRKDLSYRDFFRSISPAQLLAFSSSSSAATLPVTMECVNDNLKVKKEITSFVLPIGATVNMDGTSLYQAIAVMFLAQMHAVDLNLGQQLLIVLTATLASIGSAAVPSAGLIMLIIVLESVGLNPAWIAIIFPVDRILDMCRTVVNVTGDATVASVINATERS